MSYKLEWSDSLSVGSRVIDEDHKAFFELAHMLQNAQGSNDFDLVVQSGLSMLEEYVSGHFLREEKALKAVGYPRVTEHVLHHKKFQAQIRAMCEEYQNGQKSIAAGLPNLVGAWLVRHIQNDDMQYKSWLNDRVVDDRPLVFLAMEAEEAG